jgi:hypothetical protein
VRRRNGETICPPPKVEVAADPGDRQPGIPSKSVGCKEGATARPTPHRGEEVRCYADIHRTGKNSEGYKITFSFDGKKFKHSDSPADMPLGNGDRLYVDTIPIIHTDAFIQLLRRGVEVYCLRRLTLFKKVRGELKLPKTTRGDIKVLMHIGDKGFRRVDEDFLVMRRFITVFRSLQRTHQRLENMTKAVSEVERRVLKTLISVTRRQVEELAKEIVNEARRRCPFFNRVVEGLRIDESLTAKEALAELMTYIDITYSWTKIRNYLGLWKRDKKRRYHRSSAARKALERLTVSIKKTSNITSKDLEDTLKTIWLTLKTQKTGPSA